MSARAALSTLSLLLAFGCEDPSHRGDYQFDLGTHPTDDPTDFRVLHDGDPIDVVRGGQGALMVVGAVTTDYFGPDVDVLNIHVRLTAADGTEYTAYKYRRKVTPGAVYVPDIFLVVDDSAASSDLAWDGTEAVMFVRLETLDGDGVEREVRVVLTAHESARVQPL